jgi:hypothetical protein
VKATPCQPFEAEEAVRLRPDPETARAFRERSDAEGAEPGEPHALERRVSPAEPPEAVAPARPQRLGRVGRQRVDVPVLLAGAGGERADADAVEAVHRCGGAQPREPPLVDGDGRDGEARQPLWEAEGLEAERLSGHAGDHEGHQPGGGSHEGRTG